MNDLNFLTKNCGRQSYVSPHTSHIRIELEGNGLLASSKDEVVNASTEISIDRQESVQGSITSGSNVVNDTPFTISW